MNEKANIDGGEYSFIEVIPVLDEKAKMVLCTDTAGSKFACPEEVWLRNALPLPIEPSAPVSTNSSTQEKIECFLSMFCGREDLYAKRYYSMNTGKSGYTPACKNEWAAGICDKKAHKCPECPNRAFQSLSTEVVKAHLMGRDPYCRDVVAIYPMLEDDTTRLLAADFDEASWQADVAALRETCLEYHLMIATLFESLWESILRRSRLRTTTLLKFRHIIEENKIGEKLFSALRDYFDAAGVLYHGGSIVDATLIAAPSSTKNEKKECDPEMHQTKKGNQWYFGMKIHIGVDAGSGMVHTIEASSANVHDVDVAPKLIRMDDEVVYGDSGYLGISKREEVRQNEHLSSIDYRINRRPSQIKTPDSYPGINWDKDIEHRKSSVRSKVEHVFLIVKRDFGL